MLEHPFTTVPGGDRIWLSVGLVLVALVLWRLMSRAERVMRGRGAGIVAFELAGTRERAAAILHRWGEEGRAAARRSLSLDYAFLLAYGALLAFLATAMAAAAERRGWEWVADVGMVGAWGAFAAAAMDAVENAALLRLLSGSPHEEVPRLARAAALLKFILLGAVLAFFVVAGLALAACTD